MKITVLGSGTSTGIPVIGCSCDVCLSDDPHDKRLRSSILIEIDGVNLLIDSGPDLRQQVLQNKIKYIDYVLFTHPHYDHVAGLDELRPFTLIKQKPIDIYANSYTLTELKKMFYYIFNTPEQIGGGITDVKLHVIENKPFSIQDIEITPIPVKHGKLDIFGYRIKDFAYITDASYISPESMKLLAGTKYLIINALRYREHPTHFNVSEAIEIVKEIAPNKAYFTHIAHALKHKETNMELPEGIALAYDGMIVDC